MYQILEPAIPLLTSHWRAHGRASKFAAMTVGWQLLRAARILCGITQRELADATGVDRKTVNRIERGASGNTRPREQILAYFLSRGFEFLPPSRVSAGGILLPLDLKPDEGAAFLKENDPTQAGP